MIDFLTFETFISPTMLILFYYIGVMSIPFVSYVMSKWVKNSYCNNIDNQIKKHLSFKQHFTVILIALLCFICMQIFWRMMFEFFIAYFKMHDALMKLTFM